MLSFVDVYGQRACFQIGQNEKDRLPGQIITRTGVALDFRHSGTGKTTVYQRLCDRDTLKVPG